MCFRWISIVLSYRRMFTLLKTLFLELSPSFLPYFLPPANKCIKFPKELVREPFRAWCGVCLLFFRKKIDDALVPGWSWNEGRDIWMVKYKTGSKMCTIKMSTKWENERHNGEADLNAWNVQTYKNYFVSLDINILKRDEYQTRGDGVELNGNRPGSVTDSKWVRAAWQQQRETKQKYCLNCYQTQAFRVGST